MMKSRVRIIPALIQSPNSFTIPNPEDGDYKIITQGTDKGGDYTIEVAKITENEEYPDNAIESSTTIEGETQTNEIQEVEVEVSSDEVIYNPDTTPPVITILSPEEKDYNNDGIIILIIPLKMLDPESRAMNGALKKTANSRLAKRKHRSFT